MNSFKHEVLGENAQNVKYWMFDQKVLVKGLIFGFPGIVILMTGAGNIYTMIIGGIFLFCALTSMILGTIKKPAAGIFKGAGLAYDEILFRKVRFRIKKNTMIAGGFNDAERSSN